jgi:hypothetical protein
MKTRPHFVHRIDPANRRVSRMRLIPWLAAILIGSAALGVGCAVGFITVGNADWDALFLVGMQTALVAFVGSMVMLMLWRT